MSWSNEKKHFTPAQVGDAAALRAELHVKNDSYEVKDRQELNKMVHCHEAGTRNANNNPYYDPGLQNGFDQNGYDRMMEIKDKYSLDYTPRSDDDY